MAFRMFKYPLALTDYQTVRLPNLSYTIRHAAIQNGVICLWAEVDDRNNELIDVPIHIVGTGHEIPREAMRYIGTVHMDGLVWHIYQGYENGN